VTSSEIITISTSLDEYPNMMLVGMNVNRTSGTGKILRFSIVARQIRIVTTQETSALKVPKKSVAQAAQSKGKKAAKASSAQQSKSVLASAADKAAGFFGG
jgi:hypothetical protein